MNAKDILFDRVNLFASIFNKDLNEIGYYESKLLFDRLECSKMSFPSNPVIESIWLNKQNNIRVIYRTYENYITDIEVIDNVDNKNISINNFKSYLKIDNIEIHLMSGDIKEKYETYLKETFIFVRNSAIWEILTKSKWVDIPFDWQNHK